MTHQQLILTTSILAYAAALTAAANAWPWSDPPPLTLVGTMTESSPRDYSIEPDFSRDYIEAIDPNTTVKITIYSSKYQAKRIFCGTIYQSNGRQIDFDPEHIADRVLIPELMPQLQQVVKQAKDLDTKYMAGPHDTVVDSSGRVWRLVPNS